MVLPVHREHQELEIGVLHLQKLVVEGAPPAAEVENVVQPEVMVFQI
jgi:hypothetical protein